MPSQMTGTIDRELLNFGFDDKAHSITCSLITSIDNVFHFDSYDNQLRDHLVSVFHKHGIPLSSTVFVNFKTKLAPEVSLPPSVPTSRWSMNPPSPKPNKFGHIEPLPQGSDPRPLPCNSREFAFAPKASWAVDRNATYPVKSKQYSRIHTFTEERLSFNLDVQGTACFVVVEPIESS